ncbi:STAS domain-containing protein [Algoriphagus sp.]|uniref:STAS domain-containing protein n=1 Tax=Algoriphagus sp. TaxID=1872435 RepID=UPI0025CDA82F|nr:STAS domain-containing protein [Algoriphagus sp.]
MAEFKLKKDLTIRNVSEIHKGFADHLKQFNHLSLTLSEDIDVDFSGVQLLYSLVSHAKSINKPVSISYLSKNGESDPFKICDFEEIISTKYNTNEQDNSNRR